MNEESDLTTLMAAYLNVDYAHLSPDPWEVVRIFSETEGVRVVANAASEARALLARHVDDEAVLRILVQDHDLGYWPPANGHSGNEWLERVAAKLENAAEERMDASIPASPES